MKYEERIFDALGEAGADYADDARALYAGAVKRRKNTVVIRWLFGAAAFAVVLIGSYFAVKYAGNTPEPVAPIDRADPAEPNEQNTTPEPNDPPVPHQPTQAPPQPIDFDSYGDVLSFLSAKDVSPYARTEQETAAYRSMVDAFLDDGYIYEVCYKGSADGVERIAVYPEVRYEDRGVQGWITVDGVMYQLIVYSVRGDARISGGEAALSYYLTRGIGITSKSEIIWHNGVSYVSSTVGGENDTRRNVLYRAIDETHYLAVRSTAPTETMVGVLGSVSIEKQAIKSLPS